MGGTWGGGSGGPSTPPLGWRQRPFALQPPRGASDRCCRRGGAAPVDESGRLHSHLPPPKTPPSCPPPLPSRPRTRRPARSWACRRRGRRPPPTHHPSRPARWPTAGGPAASHSGGGHRRGRHQPRRPVRRPPRPARHPQPPRPTPRTAVRHARCASAGDAAAWPARRGQGDTLSGGALLPLPRPPPHPPSPVRPDRRHVSSPPPPLSRRLHAIRCASVTNLSVAAATGQPHLPSPHPPTQCAVACPLPSRCGPPPPPLSNPHLLHACVLH